MLIVAIVFLAVLKADAVLSAFENTDVAEERENINSIEFYLKEQSRNAAVHKSSSYGDHNWTCPIDKSSDHPDAWYKYLKSLYCEFSRYEIQVAKKSFNVADIEDWGRIHVPNLEKRPIYDIEAWKSNASQGIKIDENNFKNFLTKTGTFNIAEQDSIRNIKITELQLKELNHVLDLTIKDQMHISCIEPYMFIRGNYIIFSHINLSISALPTNDTCQKLLKSDGVKYMNIFALNTIFIDDDFRKRTNLTVIAPKFEIIGRRRIDLNGTDGKEHNTAAFENRPSLPGIAGKPGKPGDPGEPGGNFFGIGEDFIGGENLTISASGGHGSAGQDGGNGTNGKDGISLKKPFTSCDIGLCARGESSGVICDQGECLRYIYPTDTFRAIIPTYRKCSFLMLGVKGFQGGNGGNGGKGGKGGYHGDVVLIELNGHSGVTQIKINGSNGFDGKGGVGGAGGKYGNSAVVKCDEGTREWSTISIRPSNSRFLSGQNGSDGGNTENMQERRAATYISKVDKAKIINQYKSFLRTNINDTYRNLFLVNFLNRLENNQKVKNIYDFFGFVDELESLEEQFDNLRIDVNFLPFYGSLLDRISEYAQKVNTSDEKKVLAPVYTATLGRKHNLEDDLESNLITDINLYLKLVEKDIGKLKNSRDDKAKRDVINKYKQDYKDEIDKKINDANDLISKDLKPQIHVLEKHIGGLLEKWVNEIVQLQNQSIINSEKLSKSRVQLENALALQKLFGVLKIIGAVVSFMGPVGAIAGSAIGITSSLAETYMIDVPSDSDSAIENFEQSVKDMDSLKEKIKSFNDEKTSELNKALEVVSSEIKDNTDEFGDLYVKVRVIRDEFTKIDQNKITFEEVEDFKIELKTTLKTEKEKKISEAESNPDGKEKKTKAAAVLEHLQKVVELSSVVVDAFDKIEKSQEKVDEIDKAIKKNKENFDKLRECEASIYSTMMPMIEKIASDLDAVVRKSRTQAKVVLDVNKWKVQSKLKDLMLKMHEVTQNFTKQKDLERYIEKLKEVMETILNVQGYIQDYQEDQSLANFIAGINSVTADGFQDLDLKKEYKDGLEKLNIIISSSIVIQRHKVAMDAFKQFVFPFAHMFFKGLLLPSHLELENKDYNNLENLISRAVIHIEEIKSKLEEYKVTVNKCDKCIATGPFNHTNGKPFFVWKNKDNKDMISKLLSGEEVIVNANLTRSPKNADAIKFNFIKFYFKPIKNATFEQSDLNKDLKNFWVNATHLGDSHYRYGNKTYLMATADLPILYSLRNQANGEPIEASVSYDKIKKGDFMLSPYASWKIKLFIDKDKVSFKDLEKYNDTVNLVLGGMGRYVIRDCYCSDLMIDKYYKVDYMHELNAGDSMPLLEDNTFSRGRHN